MMKVTVSQAQVMTRSFFLEMESQEVVWIDSTRRTVAFRPSQQV
jgi:hypothetical protein